VGTKNPLIDGVVQLLVDISFTKDEKMEQSINTQHRATYSLNAEDKMLIVADQNKRILETITKADSVFLGRFMCIKKAGFFIGEVIGSDEFRNQMRGAKEEDRTDIGRILSTYSSDTMQCTSVFDSFPDSLNRRFIIDY